MPKAGATTDQGHSSDLAVEQVVVDRLYSRLDTLRALARDRLTAVRRAGPSGSPQNRSERDAFATLYEDRVAQLDAVEDRLCFGRLDLEDDTTRYIGRIGLTDTEHNSILTDWRAPAAEPFYRATAEHPDGVWRRRHLVTRLRRVTHLDDDVLDLARADEEGTHIAGEGALLAALARGRSARMDDIVATIQAEQDIIIRSDLAGALVVQGGPGTGKTAVALHRAAYLLYAHRRRLERTGVLLVGPSSDFLGYIDRVLPSLGETGVVNTTMASLVPGINATAMDSPQAAEIKGRALMSRVVARAVRARERIPAEPVPVRIDGRELTIRPHDVSEAINKTRRSRKPHNEARRTFVQDMLRRLADQYVEELGSGEVAPEDRSAIIEDIRSDRDVRVALNLAWFPISAERLIADLFTKPHRLAQAAPELSAEQLAALHRSDGWAWTPADVPLLDEAAELLGTSDEAALEDARREKAEHEEILRYAQETLSASGAGGGLVDADMLAQRFAQAPVRMSVVESARHDRTWTYGHIIVDEAQELSVMDWRALLRRCPTRSFTIVGDVAQSSSPAGTRSWDERLGPLFGAQLRHTSLTINYRNPAVVAEVADAAARAAGLPVTTLESARDVPDSLVTAPAADPSDLSAVGADAISRAIHEHERIGEGRVVVIATGEELTAARRALGEHVAHTPLPLDATGAPAIVVLNPREAKGLEFDVVILVAPERINEAGPGGPADLYVAMTRPTQRLVMLTIDQTD